MNGLEWNKIAAAILVSGLVAMVIGTTADALYAPEAAKKRGFEVEVALEEAVIAAGAPAVDEAKIDIAPFVLKADVKAGEAIFKKCATCHTVDKGGPNRVGPNQWGLLGSKFAHAEGFAYTDAFKKKHEEGAVWGYQELSEFLYNPKTYLPGNRMAFAGIKKPEERAALIAYLNTMSDSPLPPPEAKAAVAEDVADASAEEVKPPVAEENPASEVVKDKDDASKAAAEKKEKATSAEESTVPVEELKPSISKDAEEKK